MSRRDKALEQQLEVLAALSDPVRRSLYLYVLRQSGDVSRAQAARVLGISRALAAFHLDKLAEAGLLDVSYRRLTGRTGPGAGRPSKLYRRAARGIELTVPTRRYELAARLLAGAVEKGGSTGERELQRSAKEWGRDVGRAARERAGTRPTAARLARSLGLALQSVGFEPRTDPAGEIVLANCPFEALRDDACTTTCGMNLALCRGILSGLDLRGWTAHLEPASDRCCVVFRKG